MTRGGAREGAGRPKGQGKFGQKTKPIRIPESMISQVVNYIHCQGYCLPLYASSVSAGFPAGGDDHIDSKLDLNEHLIKNPPATFFVRVAGNSMIGAGIHEGDILIVDRSLDPIHGKVVIVAIDGQLTVKRLHQQHGKTRLLPENEAYSPIELTDENNVVIWGVVTTVLHSV